MKITKKKLLSSAIVLTALVVFVGVAHAAFMPTDWQYFRNISISGQGFTKIVLPDDIARGGQNFADIRIIANGTTEVPYFLTRNTVVRGGTIGGRILDSTVVNGSEQFVVDIGSSNQIYTGISIGSNARNFRRQVKLYSASSLLPLSSSAWSIVNESGYIFRFTDPSNGYSSGKDFIDFSAHTSRYIKVVISAGDEGPVGVTGVNIYGDRKIDVPSYSQNVSTSVFNNPVNKSSEVTIDLGEVGRLTNAVTLNVTDKNYARRVLVEVSNDATNTSSWTMVGQGSISGISTSLFSGYSNRVTYPEQKARYIRLSIVNDDNRPLSLSSSVFVEGPIISLIFETRTGESYDLYYGNPKAVTPTYDISSISSYIEENLLPQSSIGSESVSPLYVAPAPRVIPFTEAYPGLLNGMLVVVVIIIIAGIVWYLYEYMKKNKDESKK